MLNRGIIKLFLLCFLVSFSVSKSDAKVKLPTLVSDGMVLQRDQTVKIWGWADVGENITVAFLKNKYSVLTDNDGRWEIELKPAKAGGPYSMKINDIELKDILIGDVWLCAGQSNMETTIERVMDMFSNEILSYENTNIRYVKIKQDYTFRGPKDDIKPTSWQPVTQKHVQQMAAVPYFFAKFLYEKTSVPIGLVNTAVGGSAAEAWVSEKYLKDFPHYLNDLEICKAEGYVEATEALQNQRYFLYNRMQDKTDTGLKENWKNPALDDRNWCSVDMFANWGSDGVNWINGSHWLRKNINIPAHLAGQKAVLRLGCIVDSDSVFINGVFVGSTSYQYPPRKYEILVNLLKEGDNNITIRLFSGGGRPQFVEDKPYEIVFENEKISLLGSWKHRVGTRMFPLPGGVGFSNKATVLYNAMIAPLKNMAFRGVLWYQGESNTGRYNEYYGIVEALIANWRQLFNKPDLPFFIAQLPNFMQVRNTPSDGGWARLRDVQLKLSQHIPNVGLTVNIDLGEWNDIHPLNKKDVGYRLMLQAQKLAYANKNIIADGPVYESKEIKGNKVVLSFREGTNDFEPVDELKGFAIAGEDGRYQWAKAKIENGKIVVWNDNIQNPKNVRYAWADNPGDVSLRNRSNLPASPFTTEFSDIVRTEKQTSNAITYNKTGVNNSFDYELWYDRGDVDMTLQEGGAFECNWSNINNALFRTGKKFDSTKTHEELGAISVNYGCDYQPNGNSYLCLYGWSVDPLVEFYIVEAWGSWRPPGAKAKGTIKVNGGTYEIYETTRIEQPSIQGDTTFQQYWSVRTDKKTSGTISVSEHFKAWEKMGMKLGKIYEVAFCVEGFQSSGTANVYKHILTVGDTTIGGELINKK